MTASNDLENIENGDGAVIPLLIDAVPFCAKTGAKKQALATGGYFQGADLLDCQKAIESCSRAFDGWSQTSPFERRRLLLKLANLLRRRGDEVKQIIQEEIHCPEKWADINLMDSINLIEETASHITSSSTTGVIPHTESGDSYALVFPRPIGVVLGIAPWNSPLILGLRAVLAPVAAGNTAILKGSELSPKTHYFIASLFVDAGFPPGVVNFILHRPEDAPEIVDALIRHPDVRKVNFTGSTAVGRVIAQKAGQALKPVLLELGGKNCSIILDDADIPRATEAVLEGATLNAGQICMSTDLVIVSERIAGDFKAGLRKALKKMGDMRHKVINTKSASRLRMLIADAVLKGGNILFNPNIGSADQDDDTVPPHVIEDVQPSMDFFSSESFGPLLGVVVVSDEQEAIKLINTSDHGLSAAVWSRNHHRALGLARKLDVGAVHINASTVHDEATLPHGGTKSSGFGRFGASWGLQEFVQTQTIILNS